MKATLKHLCLSLLFLWTLSGCCIHQWPEQEIEPDDGRVPVRLHLHYEPDLWLWEHLYDPKTGEIVEAHADEAVDDEHPGTTDRYSGQCDHGTMRYLLRFYKPGNVDSFTEEISFKRNVNGGYDCDTLLYLEPGGYDVAVWSDLYETNESEPFYDASNFLNICVQLDDYSACTDYRDAYRGYQQILVMPSDASDDIQEAYIDMRRPMAKFEFVTTDLSEFLESETTRRQLPTRAMAEDYIVKMVYANYLPSAYSAIDDRLVDSSTGVSFPSSLTVTGDSEASMGFDFVMINDIPNAAVAVQVQVYDMEGRQVAVSRVIPVPLRRNHHTLLRGAFLTVGGSGGVNIDPTYDGDYNLFY